MKKQVDSTILQQQVNEQASWRNGKWHMEDTASDKIKIYHDKIKIYHKQKVDEKSSS